MSLYIVGFWILFVISVASLAVGSAALYRSNNIKYPLVVKNTSNETVFKASDVTEVSRFYTVPSSSPTIGSTYGVSSVTLASNSTDTFGGIGFTVTTTNQLFSIDVMYSKPYNANTVGVFLAQEIYNPPSSGSVLPYSIVANTGLNDRFTIIGMTSEAVTISLRYLVAASK